MPPSVDYGFDQLKDPNTYNVERAKKLLEEAGWKDTNGDGYVDIEVYMKRRLYHEKLQETFSRFVGVVSRCRYHRL